MRFYRDAVLETPIQWYFVPDDRDLVPYAHAFYSRIYDRDDEPQDAIGERYAPVPWRGGLPPRVVSAGGLCGTREQWEEGAKVDDLLPATWPGTPIPRCCNRPLELAIGGIGEGRVPGSCAFPILECPGLEVGPALLMTIQDIFGPTCPNLDGQYQLICNPVAHAWQGEYVIAGQPVRFSLDYHITDQLSWVLNVWMENNFTRNFGILSLVCNPFTLSLQFLVGPTFFPIVCAGGIVDTFVVATIQQV